MPAISSSAPPVTLIESSRGPLPAISNLTGACAGRSDLNVTEGGLTSYGADAGDIFFRSAGYIDRILKGASPGDLELDRRLRREIRSERDGGRADLLRRRCRRYLLPLRRLH